MGIKLMHERPDFAGVGAENITYRVPKKEE